MARGCFVGNSVQIASFFLSIQTLGHISILHPYPPKSQDKAKSRNSKRSHFPAKEQLLVEHQGASASKRGKALCISTVYSARLHWSLEMH